MAYKFTSRRLLSTPNEETFESYRRSPSPVRSSVGERLRQKYDTSSLPSRHDRHRSSVKTNDSDIPPRPTQSQTADDGSYSPRTRVSETQNYKKLYEENQTENERLRSELAEAQKKINELQARLEKAEENSTRKQALDNEKRERRALEQKLAEMEQELQSTESAEQLRKANGHLLAENNALQRIVEKLGGSVPADVRMIIEDNKSKVDNSTSKGFSLRGHKKADSAPDLLKLEKDAKGASVEKSSSSPPDSPPELSRSSSSSSLSLEDEKINNNRRGSSTSLQSSDLGSRISRYREGADASSPSSLSLRRGNDRVSSYSSSPSLMTRSASPRRPLTSSYGNTTDYGRSSAYTTSRYTSSRKDPSSNYTPTYSSLPSSSSKRDYLKSLPPSSGSSSNSSSQRLGSTFRTTPTPYGSTTSKSSYTPSSRSKLGYVSSSTGRTGTSSSSKLLSKYPTSLSSTRRTTKY